MATKTWIGDYYVDGSGAMATNCWIGKYYVDASGKWDRSKDGGTSLADTKTVYWVDNGEVYHLTKDCVSLQALYRHSLGDDCPVGQIPCVQ